ncbi:MAG: type II secretion system F family protein, partial [Opitutales bacterium]
RDEFPDRRVRTVLAGIHSQLATARSALSDAMALFPRSFSEGTIATVRVGEQAGAAALAERFADLRDQLRFRLKIRRAAGHAVAYPAFILCFATGVVSLLLVKLVPLVEELLVSLNVPLPSATRGILAVSAFVRHHGLWLLAGAALVLVLARLLRTWPPSALAFDRLLLRLPVAGAIFRALVTAEVAKTYRALYSAGASAADSLTACAAVVTNRALRAALLRARRSLETGELTADKPDHPAITEALRSTGYFPEMALTIISTGEVTGGLIRALDHVAEHYAQAAQERIAVFFAVFDKALMLALIFTVGVVILGIWQPIMTAAQNFH